MNRQRKKKGTATVMDVLNQIIEEKERDGHFRTAANYRSSMNKLAVYAGADFRHLTLGELTSKQVRDYVKWLTEQHPEASSTAEFYLRNLRAMCRSYREAHRLAWAEGSDPFSGISFRKQPTSKRALPAGLLTRLFSPQVREQLDESRRESLDVLRFIFFMRGMVFQDIWNLRHDMIGRDGHIRYRRSKTGIQIEVEIPPEAEAIIKRYFREGSPYVFPFLHHKKEKTGVKRQDGNPAKKGEGTENLSEESALRRVNRHAMEIGRLAGLCTPLTTYVLRHTWATLMLEAGYSVELIGQCLGHTSVNTTHIYLSRISAGRVDMAVNEMFNRMVRPLARSKKGMSKHSNRKKCRKTDGGHGYGGEKKAEWNDKVFHPMFKKGGRRYVGGQKTKPVRFL